MNRQVSGLALSAALVLGPGLVVGPVAAQNARAEADSDKAVCRA